MIYADTGDLEELYKPVLEMFLHGDTDYLAALRSQLETARVTSIEEDGCGVFINLEVDPATRILNPELQENMIHGVDGLDADGNEVCGFWLYVSDGVISGIDGFPLSSETWLKQWVALKNVNYDIVTGLPYYSDSWNSAALSKLSFAQAITTEGSVIPRDSEEPYAYADMRDFEHIAQVVIEMILSGDGELCRTLRERNSHSSIDKIEHLGDIRRIIFKEDSDSVVNENLQWTGRIAGIVCLDDAYRMVAWFYLVIADGSFSILEGTSLLMNRWPEGEVSLWYLNRDEEGHEYLTATLNQT